LLQAGQPPRKQRSLLDRGVEDLTPKIPSGLPRSAIQRARQSFLTPCRPRTKTGLPWGAETNPRRSQRITVGVGAHEVPPRSGHPTRDQHRGCPHLLPERSPHFPDQVERAINPAILALPLLSNGIDAGRAPAPVQGKEPSTLVVSVRRDEVYRV